MDTPGSVSSLKRTRACARYLSLSHNVEQTSPESMEIKIRDLLQAKRLSLPLARSENHVKHDIEEVRKITSEFTRHPYVWAETQEV